VIFTIFFVYIDLLAKDFNTRSEQFNFIMFEKWWFYARLSLVVIIVCLILSLVEVFAAFNDIYMIKFPNYCPYIPTLDLSNGFIGSENPDCTYQNVLSIQYQGNWIPLFVALVLLSIGVASHYRNVRNYGKHFEEGPLSPIYKILKQVVITEDESLDEFRKGWEKRVLKDYFQSVVDNCITYEDFINADDSLLKTFDIKAHGHRKKILEITNKLREK